MEWTNLNRANVFVCDRLKNAGRRLLGWSVSSLILFTRRSRGSSCNRDRRIVPDTLPQNRLLEALLKHATLTTSSQLQAFTLAASYWTLFIEGSVTIVFLINSLQLFSRFRDWFLIVFIATTYFLPSVLGFAYIPIIMEFAQCFTPIWNSNLLCTAVHRFPVDIHYRQG